MGKGRGGGTDTVLEGFETEIISFTGEASVWTPEVSVDDDIFGFVT
jgi:hypothetical protein